MKLNYLKNFSKTNVILGKNGCGKSHILKKIEQDLSQDNANGLVRYISPERGGQLSYNSSVLDSIQSNPLWLSSQRRSNQVANFRMQSVAQFHNLEIKVLRRIEKEHTEEGYVPTSFNETLAPCTKLLNRVRLERADPAFKLFKHSDNSEVKAEHLSSGESELISLAIEILSFKHDCDLKKNNYLLIDEPDVHLHPDLQAQFASFLLEALKDQHIYLIIATHSTPILSALATSDKTVVAFMRQGDTQLDFISVNNELKKLLPMFGAHPLSNIFNESPILLVEGEDDERIWQQAIKTSQGKIKLYPCVTDSVDILHKYEKVAVQIMGCVYDNPKGYSLRDRDEVEEDLDDIEPLVRLRLNCREAENLLLTDDVLQAADTNWDDLQEQIKRWVMVNTEHRYYKDLKAFVDSGMDRKNTKLKNIRNLLNGFLNREKAWEIAVGQAIGRLSLENGLDTENSLKAYLGEKTCQHLLAIQTEVPSLC